MSHGNAPSSSPPRLSRSSLVGRERELQDALRALDAGHRLVSLVGAPGIGKTRVAERLALELTDRRPVVWVDLQDARDGDDLVSAVAEAIGVSLAAASSAEAPTVVERALAATPRVLFLDNFEQLLVSADEPTPARRAADAVVAGWLDATAATVVCTSRARLRLRGEVLVEVGPLSVASSIALFEARVNAAAGSRTELPLDQMERVVQRLAHNPLAIEIAAARTPLLGIAELLLRIDGRDAAGGATPATDAGLKLLALDARDRSARHASLSAALEWSWALLSEAERGALVQLTAFRGGFLLEAAEAVLSVPGRTPLDLVEALRDRSLLDVERGVSGVRFQMNPLVRDLAGGHADATTLRAARTRHAAYFARARALPEDAANLEAALLMTTDDALLARLALALAPTLGRRGSRDAHERILGRGVAGARAAGLHAVETELLQARAGLASAAGEVGLARDCQERALTLANAANDDGQRAFALARLGWDLFELEDLDTGLAHMRSAVATAQRARQVAREAYARNRLGNALLALGQASEAIDELARASTLASETEDAWLRKKTLVELVAAQRRLGLVDGAARRLVELDGIVAGSDDVIGVMALRERGGLLRAQGRLAEAEEALREAELRADAIAAPRIAADVRALRARNALDRGDLALAQRLAEAALTLATRVEAVRYRGAALVVLASTRAMAGDPAGARAALDRAEHAVAPRGRTLDALTHAAVLTERALLCAEDGDAEAQQVAIEALLTLTRPLNGAAHGHALALAAALGAGADDRAPERTAAADRALSRATDEDVRASLLAARGAHAPTFATSRRIEQLRSGRRARELLVARDGRFYEVDGRRTSLLRQRCLRLIFLALVEHAERAPGQGLTQSEVLARGWPGEKMRTDSGATRVYTSIRRLRKSGLLGVLVTRDDGYLLDPTVQIRRMELRA